VSALVDRIAALLEELGPLSAEAIARALRCRKADVIAALHSDPRFARSGKTRGSRWSLAPARSFDAAEAALRWRCRYEVASEILFGPSGFLERGYVQSLNGNGRVVVTKRGLAESLSLVGVEP
jgi:hypothetical protein